MSLNASYITALDLSESLLDKDTGATLAGGTVWFYEDASRTTPKLVYELSGAPPNYTYTALPNPITLNAIGAFSDNSGSNVSVYYYPYDNNTPPNLQLYYIAVYSASGVLQFTREAWPNLAYNPNLNSPPYASNYLVGWDFAYNPVQFYGFNVPAFASGANTSSYVWDQTILFQSVNSGAAVNRAASGSLAFSVTATNATQFALIQYIEVDFVRNILTNEFSINMAAVTPMVGGLGGTISVWYSTDTNLPSLLSNNSIVATLDANGKPATFHGNWVEVTRGNLGDATFTVVNSASSTFNNYGFNGWDLDGGAAAQTANWMAIVVGFTTLSIANHIDIQSICMSPGPIPSLPNSTVATEVLPQSQRYYESCFAPGVTPASNVGLTSGAVFFPFNPSASATITIYDFVPFNSQKRVKPTITILNPSAANGLMRDVTNASDSTAVSVCNNTVKGFNLQTTPGSFPGGSAGDICAFYWVADSRLGVVN